MFVVGCLVFPFDGKRRLIGSYMGRLWGKVLLLSQGVFVRVENIEKIDKSRACMYVANHTSYLDPPAVAVGISPLAGPRFVFKKELLKLPMVGWYAAMNGHFVLDRGNVREGMKIMDRAAARANDLRLSPVMFPEGTRSVDGRLGPLRAGAFELAMRAKVPVHPMAVFGSFELMPKGAPAPRRSGVVRVVIGDPIEITPYLQEGGGGRKALARDVRAALLALGIPGDA